MKNGHAVAAVGGVLVMIVAHLVMVGAAFSEKANVSAVRENSERIATLEARTEMVREHLLRIETKLDRLVEAD